ncbi:MAG TPA: enolase C-terminal domain-like protein [Candidatus Nanoarchaeia archaeon]|nr:enolase C-terminal domain-like protein [Candidatus Nanoarchaeia archaeon]
MLIKEIKAEKIPDSRGEQTIKVLVDGVAASSPSGKSTGKYETKSYNTSLDFAIEEINHLNFNFEITKFEDLKKVENFICKKYHFKTARQFGANALFALESAILKALAKSKNKQLWQIVSPKAKVLPVPVGNAIGGGLHSSRFKVRPVFQEFLIIPNEKTFKENVATMRKVYDEVGKILKAEEKNDEGAWHAAIHNRQALDILEKFKDKIKIGLDVAASSFFKNESYNYKTNVLSRESQIQYMNSLVEKFDIYYLEDPLQEEDFMGFSLIKQKHLVVGDDLTATQIQRLKEAIKHGSINAMIIKPNQNGSLLELKKVFDLCKANNIKTILSHRSGETMDASIADYAFAFGADFIKCGISTAFREAKLRRMIEIESSLR